MADPRCIAIMFRPPVLGIGKRRLAAEVGDEIANDLSAEMLLEVKSALDSRAYPVIPFATGDARLQESPWPSARIQPSGDLGWKMAAVLETALSEFESAMLIGCDVPQLCGEILDDAFELIEENEVVIGPSSDGGYYLIGFDRSSYDRSYFTGVAWSTPRVLSMTRQKARLLGHQVGLAAELIDIDTLEDLRDVLEMRERPVSERFRRVVKTALKKIV